ncbi:tellurite resistance TerB family protein [Botrimarina hoheduenensis]|uniref:Inner membrane protein YebE n=1 Tax=Botrimarina hoheduenensis TaxID=2528000 RepID=A0A5C5VQA2_9BACT|nr:DUF533 domain-containing protein [Botrimarina hoheduenensis]TWT40818.1 Inner membrane protein YebE [Botrimarina hoheduenensis]
MDAIQLLGTLLGGQQVVSPSGQRVLRNNHPAFRTAPAPAPRAAGGLSGVLGGAATQYGTRQRRAPVAQPRAGHAHPDHAHQGHGGFNAGHCDDDFGGFGYQDAHERALLLIRAMIYAARADGRIDDCEEAEITRRFGPHLSSQEVRFVHGEIRRPITPCDFAREIPRGLEEEVYAASLIAIDVDNNAEARYLHDLAHELGLSHQDCNRLHRHFGEPPLFP